MKLVIQIPCYNEAETLPSTLADLPRELPGIDSIERLVIDDGSADGTARVAEAAGVDRVVVLPKHLGLAYAFRAGLEEAVRMGADIIVNTDGDNQYRGEDVAALVKPIVEGRAEMVIGTRDLKAVGFSAAKRLLQKIGSYLVRKVSGTRVPDATSGFRAFSRDAAMRLHVFSAFTYTLETIIQAGKSGIGLDFVPVRTNSKTRESRLYSSVPSYLMLSVQTIIRIYAVYEPMKMFLWLGLIPMFAGGLLGVRFMYYFFHSGSQGHIQSLILSAILIIIGFQTIVFGLLADLSGANRRLMEDALYRLRRLELDKAAEERRLHGADKAP